MSLSNTLNQVLDGWVRPHVHVCGRSWPAFRACLYAGLGFTIIFVMGLASPAGLSPVVMICVTLAAVGTFFAHVMLRKIVTGKEQLTYYHHMLAVLPAVAMLLRLAGKPVLPYLDIVVLGLGLNLAVAKVGCLLAGCCHGRPCAWGVSYRPEHARAGFPSYLVAVRLFPVQALESLAALGIVLGGSALVLKDGQPGAALAWYVAAYAIVRFCLEFARGNPERTYFGGFSEAQWTSLILMSALSSAELVGAIPREPWHLVATVCLACTIAFVALNRRHCCSSRHRIFHPFHVREVAEAIERSIGAGGESGSAPAEIRAEVTALGIRISADKIRHRAGWIHHYAMSTEKANIGEEDMKDVAKLVCQLRHSTCDHRWMSCRQGVFHLLVYPPSQTGSAYLQKPRSDRFADVQLR
jgi:Prolipoprotein diacylglyceryl transferase